MSPEESSFFPPSALLLDLLDHGSEAMAIIDSAGLVVYANHSMEEILGLPVEEILDQPLPVACDPGPPRELEIPPRKFNRRAQDRPRLAAVRCIPASGGAGLKLVYLRDLTERQDLKQELRDLTLKDELTHLYNFRTFIRFAEHQLELGSRMKKQMVLVRLRLSDLAGIASRLGTKLADSALLDLTELLVKTFRKSDLLSRIGLDEFGVLAINSLGVYQSVITDRLKGNLVAFAARERRPYPLKISCGTTWFDPDAPQPVAQLLNVIRLEAWDNL